MDESADASGGPAPENTRLEASEQLKEGLVANNNHEVYRLLGRNLLPVCDGIPG